RSVTRPLRWVKNHKKSGRGQCPARSCFLPLASLPLGVPCQSASCPLLPCFRPRPVPARGRDRCGQNVTLQLLSVPVSPLPLSFTRRFQVPFRLSPDRSTV